MLVLARRPGQRIVIDVDGVEIVVTVAAIKDGKVRLGITAPEDVRILRGELVENGGVGTETQAAR